MILVVHPPKNGLNLCGCSPSFVILILIEDAINGLGLRYQILPLEFPPDQDPILPNSPPLHKALPSSDPPQRQTNFP